MDAWLEDLLAVTVSTECEQLIFDRIKSAALALGFEFCAYGNRAPLPLTRPKIVVFDNYPLAWRERYFQAGYVHVDPVVRHGRRTQSPVVWSKELFSDTPQLWEEAQSHGLRFGWAQSSLDGLGVGGMLVLSRSGDAVTDQELDAHGLKLRWLSHVAHMALARALKAREHDSVKPCLTVRELEVLKWTANGKSSQDIADILTVSKNTVDFHVKNAVTKLHAANKTAAVVRAAMMGYLN